MTRVMWERNSKLEFRLGWNPDEVNYLEGSTRRGVYLVCSALLVGRHAIGQVLPEAAARRAHPGY